MSSSTTSGGSSLRGRLKRGTSVDGWRAIASIVARRSMRPRALASWRRRRTGASGSGSSSAQRLGQLEFLGRHRFEIGLLQALAIGEREGRLVLDLVVLRARGRLGLGVERAAARALRRGGSGASALAIAAALHLRQQLRQHLLEQLRIAPEGGRRRRRRAPLLVAVEHHGRERGVHVVAPVEAHRLERRERGEHAVGPDRHAGGAQHPREVRDVLGEHGPLKPGRRQGRARAARRASCVTSPPCILTMSSWYLSSTPSVSCTLAGRGSSRSAPPARWPSRSSRRCRAT